MTFTIGLAVGLIAGLTLGPWAFVIAGAGLALTYAITRKARPMTCPYTASGTPPATGLMHYRAQQFNKPDPAPPRICACQETIKALFVSAISRIDSAHLHCTRCDREYGFTNEEIYRTRKTDRSFNIDSDVVEVYSSERYYYGLEEP